MRLIDADALDAAFTDLRFNTDRTLKHWGDRQDWCLHGSEVEKLIDNAPTVSGWVSVKDRLPDKPCACLLFNIYGWRTFDFWEDDGWEISDENEITHWMPLPEPPADMEAK